MARKERLISSDHTCDCICYYHLSFMQTNCTHEKEFDRIFFKNSKKIVVAPKMLKITPFVFLYQNTSLKYS